MRIGIEREQFRRFITDVFGRDLARPMEWFSLLTLLGWLQFLVTQPEVFRLPRYDAFSWLPPVAWASIIGAIVVAQLVALRSGRHSQMIRFVAMALAAGIWTIIALSFWSAVDIAPTSARTNSVIALATAFTAVYLGLNRQR